MSTAHDTVTDESAGASESQPPAPTSAAENLSQKLEKMNISSASFSIWPPTQRTRDAVINRLIETLANPSVLSKRYGSMPHDEASSTARVIEEEAYTAAAAAAGDSATASVDEGIEILQMYSKEISKRMLEAVKSRAAATATPPPADDSPAPENAGTATTTTEEASSVDNESSS